MSDGKPWWKFIPTNEPNRPPGYKVLIFVDDRHLGTLIISRENMEQFAVDVFEELERTKLKE